MQLGNFSVSLAVNDLKASKEFYAKLGFTPMHGEEDQGWLIVRNDDCLIGLFQKMFEKNILTFNPGWDSDSQTLPEFTDVREIQKNLEQADIQIIRPVDETTSGPGSLVIEDPDGNHILIDQHV